MVPRTYPSTFASNGQQQMVVYYLTSVVGLQRWVDYIPVKLTQGGTENSYNNNGYINVAVLPSLSSQTQAWKEYIPVYQDDVATDAWQVNSIGYIPYNYAQFGDASLMLDFTNGGSIDPRVTFTRTSNATVTDSTGTLVYAPHNLLRVSEQFDVTASGWTTAEGSISANATLAPDGTQTADKYVENTALSAFHRIIIGFSTEAIPYTLSVHAKAEGRNFIRLSNASDSQFAYFNVSTGALGTVSSGVEAVITPVANGFYRCSITFTPASAAIKTIGFNAAAVDNSTNYQGDGTSGIFLWGAQLNVGSLQPYYPTTRKNLLGFTQEFDNAGWTKSNSSVTADAAVDPQGFMTADKLVEGTGSIATFVIQSPPAYVAGTPYTFTCYAKEDPTSAKRYLMLLLPSAAFGSNIRGVFDLGDGTFTTTGTATVSMDFVGNGWWRCRVTATASTTTSSGLQVRLSDVGTGSVSSYTGDGTSGIYIWGAQLSDSASLDPYVYNPGAAPASTAYFGPRFDYDPVTLAPKGLLIEEQRTNSIRNNTMVGAVAGSPGTAPTNWISWVGTTNGITSSIVGVGTESGVSYLDVRFQGTSTVTGTYANPAFDAAGAISAANGQTWTETAYLKLVAGSLDGVTLGFRITNQAFTGLGDSPAFSVTSGSLLANRFAYTLTIADASTTGISPRLRIALVNGTAYDFTLRIGLPQLEQGAFATSVIPTTTAAATRAADVAVMTGANFSNWYNQTEGSFYIDADMFDTQFGFFRYLLAANDASGSTTNLVALLVSSNSSNMRFAANAAGAVSASLQQSLTLGSAFKGAVAYKVDDFAVSYNGGTPLTDTSGDAPSGINTLVFGNISHTLGAGNHSSTHIRRVAYFPRRLANAELQGITS